MLWFLVVSHLALDDFSDLQKKYEMEIEFREQAEKIAAEVQRIKVVSLSFKVLWVWLRNFY